MYEACPSKMVYSLWLRFTVSRKRFTLYDYGLLSLENGLLSMITVYCLSKTVYCRWLRFTVSRKRFTLYDNGLLSRKRFTVYDYGLLSRKRFTVYDYGLLSMITDYDTTILTICPPVHNQLIELFFFREHGCSSLYIC